DSAEDFKGRAFRSRRRLILTVGAAVVISTVMLALIVALLVIRGNQPSSDLTNRVENVLLSEGKTPAERLNSPRSLLRESLNLLRQLRSDPGFVNLPKKDQDELASRMAELEEYLAYLDKLLAIRQPSTISDEAALQNVEDSLRQALPRPEWDQTDAGRLQESR